MKSQEAKAVRLVAPHFPPRQAACRGAKDERIRQLHRELRAYAEQHPKASHYMLDPSSAYDAVWQCGADFRPEIEPSRMTTKEASHRGAQELVELRDNVDSYLLASLIAVLNGDLKRSRDWIREGLSTQGQHGYAAMLLLQEGLSEQLDGQLDRSLESYRAAAATPVAAPRRSALAAGAFAAAASGREGDLDWFLQRMGAEDEPHQRGILDRVAHLRRNRLGEASVERSLQLMQDRALELKGAPDWMVA
ncbi:MAG: hypothetical protein ISQ11_15085 [Planctomycetes bacterium]|nr:hypothetical protein [Planctomycetota bacterium]